jgi:hypothetical protein
LLIGFDQNQAEIGATGLVADLGMGQSVESTSAAKLNVLRVVSCRWGAHLPTYREGLSNRRGGRSVYNDILGFC